MSTHEIAIVQIDEVIPHPNPEATKMEVTHIWGWQCCIEKGKFHKGDKAIYVPPDYEVDTLNPLFSFLHRENEKYARIKVRRMKGAISQGLVIPVPEELDHLPVGTNVIEQLGIRRYEPCNDSPVFMSSPSGIYEPKFDVESLQRFLIEFIPGEIIVVTEKIHGTSARFTYAKNTIGEYYQFCGSRTGWVKESYIPDYREAFDQNPDIGRWCKDHPDLIIYGEVFGQVKHFKYGATKNRERRFAPFAILNKNSWLDYDICQQLIDGYDLQWVPLVYRGPFDFNKLLELAEGKSLIPGANHIREGIVIVPEKERTSESIGRVALKLVSNDYLSK
jgi:RNA ligase (TIGR02306 family)